MAEMVLVLDLGGPYKELIARVVRNLGVYSEICSGDISAKSVKEKAPIAIILAPNDSKSEKAPTIDKKIYDLGIPILGICYGMELMCKDLGGTLEAMENGEFGRSLVTQAAKTELLPKEKFTAHMNCGNAVKKLPIGFVATAATENCVAAIEDVSRKCFGVQFHPETSHTQHGTDLIHNFLYKICEVKGDYKLDDYIDLQIEQIREIVGDERVLLALSGGVDSSVCAALLSRAIPNQLTCIFVDHGFMRLDEGDEIEEMFVDKNVNLIRVNAQERFLNVVKGLEEPEAKRKAVGREFINVFEEESAKLDGIAYLAQGTIYPDIVESGSANSAVIKSHHNVGGLPENLNFKGLVEPLSGLFKDEVRAMGKKLGLPDSFVNRQPFPGPGLAIRCIGEITFDKLETLRKVDNIMRFELGLLSETPSQYFAVLTNTLSVGVKGEKRTYDPVVALRAVTTDDFMTCTYSKIPHEVLSKVSARITAEVESVSRVVYDITDKPPGTIEWE